jgi:hypothetical protein
MASSPPAPAIPDPSLWEAVKETARTTAGELFPGVGSAQKLKDNLSNNARVAMAPSDFAARSVFHPVQTLGTPEKRAAALREGMRGVNSNIPFANPAVEAIGGPPADSPEDAAAAPGARAFGTVAGLPVGGLAARSISAAVPVAERALGRVGESAVERNVGRAKEALEMRVNKRTRGNLQVDTVDRAIRENPEIGKAAGNDAKLAQVTEAMTKRGQAQLAPIYGQVAPLEDIAAPITNMDKRIGALEQGTAADRAVAKKLQTIRDEMNTAYGKRGAVSVQDLRAEQTAYQKAGYGKAMPGDEAATAAIAANREASKAVGDAVVNHVTGMDYAEAKAAAAADPNSLAARLFKANDQISAANKIEAGIADRAGRVKPKTGIIHAIAHPIETAEKVATNTVGAIPARADAMLARIVQTVRSGAPVPPELVSQAVAAGVKSSTISDLMNRRGLQPATP